VKIATGSKLKIITELKTQVLQSERVHHANSFARRCNPYGWAPPFVIRLRL
jgi:hypothetical protein